MYQLRFIILLIGLFIGNQITAQVTIEEPVDMDRIIADYARLYSPSEEITGWSILVALDRDRRKIDEIQGDFKYRYPEYREFIEWRFENPYYKILVGAFENPESSLPLLHKIRKHYPGAFEVKNSFHREDIMRFRRMVRL
jgi:hypothetical protein